MSASISTPVRPKVSTCAVQRTLFVPASSSKSTATRLIGSGWHSGISSDVRLAAWIAAMRATPSTSPFFALPLRISSSVAGSMRISPAARATRCVSAFAVTSTM